MTRSFFSQHAAAWHVASRQPAARAWGIATLAVAVLATMPQAQAEGAAPPSTVANRPADADIGADTRALLATQRNGNQAGRRLPMAGAQAALAYQRYLRSFDHPIPERFVGQTGVSAGAASSGQGGALASSPSR